jgi:hypothetical protein
VIRLLLVLAGLLALVGGSAGAATGQSLELVLHSDVADTRGLAQYDAALPIALRVDGDATQFDAVTVTANGPDGTAIKTVLARTAGGFGGALRLMTPGTWTLALQTQLGSVTGDVADFAVQVVSPVDATAGEVGVGLSLACVLGGVALLVAPRLRRRAIAVRTRS